MLQIPAQVFHAAPGAAGLFGKVHLPGAAILRMQVTVPPVFVADMAETWQGTGIDACIVVAQQINDGVAPDSFHLFLFKEQLPPDVVFDVKTAAGGAAKQVVEQGPVVIEKRPQQMRHSRSDMLPVSVGEDVLLLGNPLLGGLEATIAVSLGLATLAEEAGMGAVRRGTAVAANAHAAGVAGVAGVAGEHALNGKFGPVAEGVTVFVEILAPAVVMLEQQLCRSRNIHDAEFTGR